MIPPSEVRVLDRNAEALGVPIARLMENAGKAVAEEAAKLSPKAALVVAGPGNNGGDGVAAARHLARGRKVTVVLAVRKRDAKSALLRAQLRRLPGGVRVVELPEVSELTKLLSKSDVVVDALLGVGIRGEPREPFRSWVRAINESGKQVVSVDVPSGFGTSFAVKPQVTVALHDVKEGQAQGNSGRIVVRDIGIPPMASTHTGPGELTLYPLPRKDQHKGQGGIVLVIGGGPYTGAPALTAMAAMRTGANLAVVLTPARAADIVASYSPNLIVRPFNGYDVDLQHPDNLTVLEEWLPRATAVCVGNGLGRADRALRSVTLLLERLDRSRMPIVIDGDAIHALGSDKPELRRNIVVTPHAAEFQALTGEALAGEDNLAERVEQARSAARKLGCTLIAKGHASIITDGERAKINTTGNPGMSTGGTGDVLAGITGALLGKQLDAFDAARLAAWMSGRAGDIAFEEKRFGLLATDVLEAIPAVFREAGLHWR